MGAKDEQGDTRDAIDRRILAHLETLGEGEGVTTHPLAEALRLPWQAVAKSLGRLAASRRVLVTEVERKDWGYRVRRERHYRLNLGMVATLPEWLAPKVHVVRSARLVKGRAGSD